MMQSEETLRYSLNYTISYDVEVAKETLPRLWEESDGDEELFLEFMHDNILASLEELETAKQHGKPMPPYITHFSLKEEIG